MHRGSCLGALHRLCHPRTSGTGGTCGGSKCHMGSVRGHGAETERWPAALSACVFSADPTARLRYPRGKAFGRNFGDLLRGFQLHNKFLNAAGRGGLMCCVRAAVRGGSGCPAYRPVGCSASWGGGPSCSGRRPTCRRCVSFTLRTGSP
jgi:hypothetical protein